MLVAELSLWRFDSRGKQATRELVSLHSWSSILMVTCLLCNRCCAALVVRQLPAVNAVCTFSFRRCTFPLALNRDSSRLSRLRRVGDRFVISVRVTKALWHGMRHSKVFCCTHRDNKVFVNLFIKRISIAFRELISYNLSERSSSWLHFNLVNLRGVKYLPLPFSHYRNKRSKCYNTYLSSISCCDPNL